MSRSKQTSKSKLRRKAVTALGVAGAVSLAGSASASIAPTGDTPTRNAAPVTLAEEEISDVSLATFYVFDKENEYRSGVQLAARGCGHGCGRGCGGRGCAVHRGCRCGGLRRLRLRRLGRRLLHMDWTCPGLLTSVRKLKGATTFACCPMALIWRA